MLERLLEVNQIAHSGKGDPSLIDQLNEGLPPAYDYGLAVCFDDCGGYLEIKLTRGRSDVIYMSGPPMGCDPTGISKFGGKVENVVARLKRSLQALAASPITKDIHPLLSGILENYDQPEIAAQVKRKLEELDTKAVCRSEDIHPLYLEKCVQEYMVKDALRRYSSIPGKKQKGASLLSDNRDCSVCGSQGKLVYGNFSRLKCYNIDKRGMISGGFDYGKTVANFPVCLECIGNVSAGFTFAYTKENLTFSLCGERYLLLPTVTVKDGEMREFVLETIQREKNRSTLKSDILKHITNSEKELLQAAARPG